MLPGKYSSLLDFDLFGLRFFEFAAESRQPQDAIFILSFQAAFQGMRDRKRVVLDAAGYRARREEVISERADRAAEKAIAGGEEVELDPMTARERRIVHEHLKGRTEVETFSAGDEPRRRVVVAPLLSE